MFLSTNDLLVPADDARNHVEPVNPAGWSEICKGLYGILAGYLLLLATVIVTVVLAFMVIFQLAEAHSHGGAGVTISTLIVGAMVLGLLLLGGYGVIIRSQWRCLRNAPEKCGAKWWMFSAMLCVVAGPVMGTATSLAGGDDSAAQARALNKMGPPETLREALAESKEVGAKTAPMKIVSSSIGLLGQVFFVLFLRSVALCFNDRLRARLTEIYLLFTGLLFAGVVGLILRPEIFLAKPVLLLLLGGGWMFSGLCYFALIVSTCACIHKNLAVLRAQPVVP